MREIERQPMDYWTLFRIKLSNFCSIVIYKWDTFIYRIDQEFFWGKKGYDFLYMY